MLRFFAALLAILSMQLTAAADDFGFPLNATHEELNEASTSLGLSRNSFKIKTCGQDVRATCQIVGLSTVGIAAGEIDGLTDELTLIHMPGEGDATEAMFAFGVLIATASPELSADERGKLLQKLLQPVLQKGEEKASKTVSGVTYTFINSMPVGLWFIATTR